MWTWFKHEIRASPRHRWPTIVFKIVFLFRFRHKRRFRNVFTGKKTIKRIKPTQAYRYIRRGRRNIYTLFRSRKLLVANRWALRTRRRTFRRGG